MNHRTPARPGSAGPGRQGVALLVAVLVTGAVLFVIVSVTAGLATGTRRVNADERKAYAALNTTESGLNTFPIRMWAAQTNKPLVLTGSTPAARATQFQSWLTDNGLLSYTAADGTATLTISSISATGSDFVEFDAIYKGTTSTPGSSKEVAQRYHLQLIPKGGGMYAPAAMTSLPDIDASKGSGQVSNYDKKGNLVSTTSSGLLGATVGNSTLDTNDPTKRTFNFTMDNAAGLRQGDYLIINGLRYRINRLSGNSLNVTVVPLSVAAPASIPGGSGVSLIMNASQETKTATFTELKVSNYTDFHAGETIFIGAKKATIQSIKADGTLVLQWATLPAPTTINEGDVVARDAVAMRSAGSIDVSKYNSYGVVLAPGTAQVNDCSATTDCRGQDDPYLNSVPNQNELTRSLFGLSDAELNAKFPLITNLTAAKNALSCTAGSAGILHTDSNTVNSMFSGNASYCGLLIVDGDVNNNLNATVTFDGFIYFRGHVRGKINGNITITGGVAVSGGQIEGLTDDYGTNLTGNAAVIFNPALIRRALMSVDPTGGLGTHVVASTWRQR